MPPRVEWLLMLGILMLCLSVVLQKLKPEYSKAATALNEHDSTIVIGMVRVFINKLS